MTEPTTPALRVLVVEDSPTDAKLVTRALQLTGRTVEWERVEDAAEMRAALETKPWDLVISDWSMPTFSALEALGVLKATQLDLPFIVVSGTVGEELAVEAMRLGAHDYVLKDKLTRLAPAVERELREHHLRQAQHRSEQLIRKLTLAVDQSPAAILITDTRGTIEYVNARFTEITGYSAAEAIGQTPRVLKSGNTPPETYVALWNRIQEGQVWYGEIQNRRRNGEIYWDSTTISPIRDGTGAITHFLAIQQDITERRRIEGELREREERFRQLAENISEVFFIVDAEFRQTLYINPAYERLWGESCESLYEDPMSFLNPLSDADRTRLLAHMARIRVGEDAGPLEFQVQPRGRTPLWVLSHAVPVRNEQGEVYRISGFVLDITDRRRAEEALQTSERRLRALFETVNLIGLVLDVNGNVEYMNPFALRLTGYSSDEAMGRSWFDFLPEAERPTLADRFAELLHQGLHPHYRNAILTRSGKRRLIAWHNTVLYDDRGQPSGTLSMGEDITEHAQLEEQYRQAQKMEAIGQLAGGIAHDFNNLLSVILSYSSLISEVLPPNDPIREDLAEIRMAGERAASLTRQLLAFTRQQVLQPTIVNINDIVRGIEKMLRRVIGEDIELFTTCAEDLGRVLVDPAQIEQVIMNLIVNARDAMPTGGRLTIETANVTLDEAYVADHVDASVGPHAMLAVTDSGIGMDHETQSRIFEPFFTTKELGKGTGLGLSTVFGIVRQSGGSIQVYSEPGLGTTFKIHLPLVGARTGEPQRAQQISATRGGTETILLVEDEDRVRAVASAILRHYGYQVLEASAGDEALRVCEQHPTAIHLLLTDVVMPRMNGRELADRARRVRPPLKVLFMSGYTGGSVVNHAILEPNTAFLQKPITPELLARKVRSILDTPLV